MFKVLVINEFQKKETISVPAIPRIGDTLPLFYTPFPKIQEVLWLPHKIMPHLPIDIAVVVYVG